MFKQRWIKTVLFSLLPSILLLSCVELLVRVVYYQKHAPYTLGLVQVLRSAQQHLNSYNAVEVVADARRFEADPILGYKTIPGAYTVTFRTKGKTLLTREIIGADGYRTTALNPSEYMGKPELWFLGCSYTWGYSVNNDQTFPWLIQQSVSGWRVRNLGRSGYSDLHALLQLETAVRNGERLPEIAVFVFEDFHPERNAGSPKWLAQIHSAPDMPVYLYPRAVLDPAGRFSVEYVPLVESFWKGKPDFSDSDMTLITNSIFDRILKLCSSHGIRPVFALQRGSLNDPIVKHAAEIGFEVDDISVDLTADNERKYKNLPFDWHPNPAAHLEYYKRLLPVILRLTQETPKRSDSSVSRMVGLPDGLSLVGDQRTGCTNLQQ